ncbi:MAG: LysR family transcriptional regulator [Aestuariivirgaceae bacterium]
MKKGVVVPTLLEVLRREYSEFPPLSLRASELEGRVAEMFLSTGAPCSSHSAVFKPWPGPNQDVFRWFVLDDGMAIGLTGDPGTPENVVRFPLKSINHIDWNRLRTFMLVHEAGSFTKAGKTLKLTQSAVSRQIKALEEDIGSPLFIRSSGGLVLTEAGEHFLDTVSKIWENLQLGLARLEELRDLPSGPLHLTTTVGFGSAWLTSRIASFHKQYPDMEITLLLIDNLELDLLKREAECAIRFQKPSEPNLVHLYSDDFSYHIYGSKSYLEERGIPETLDDLQHHNLIVYGDGVGHPPIEKMNWLLTEGLPDGARRTAALKVNSVYGMYRAVESGLGLAALPFYMSERSSEVVEVLPQIEGPRIPLYFVYPEELRPSRRIATLRDFIVGEIRKTWPSVDAHDGA